MRVSVVVPVYTAETWIEKTLESVVQQGDNVEVIVVDDHSPDRSADVAREFLDRNAAIGKVITTDQNRGPAHARNLGWKSATSEWIQFLDADDLLAPGKFDLQCARAESVPEDVAVLYSPWQGIGLLNGEWSPSGPIVRSDVDQDTVSSILKDRQFGYVGPVLVRRRALQAVGGFSVGMTLGEDLDLMLRIAMSGYRFEQVPSVKPLFLYRDTPESLWHHSAAEPSAVMQLMRSIREAETFLARESKAPIATSTKLAIAARYLQLLDVLRNGDRNNFDRVLKWISDLQLRSAPPGAAVPTQLVAMIAGLGNATRIKCALRHTLRSLRAERARK
jgi:cellulose synthase/poly-beta-1,6-N-acetylglucosamine synthase-like glycosyltransferase